jgi:hypothetical protein
MTTVVAMKFYENYPLKNSRALEKKKELQGSWHLLGAYNIFIHCIILSKDGNFLMGILSSFSTVWSCFFYT